MPPGRLSAAPPELFFGEVAEDTLQRVNLLTCELSVSLIEDISELVPRKGDWRAKDFFLSAPVERDHVSCGLVAAVAGDDRADALRGGPQRIIEQVRIASGRPWLGMPK